MAFSNIFKEVVRKSKQFAESMGKQSVGTEHMLYGIIAEKTSQASKILDNVGVTIDKYESVMKSYLNKQSLSLEGSIDFSKTVNAIFVKISDFYEKNASKQQDVELLLLLLVQNEYY